MTTERRAPRLTLETLTPATVDHMLLQIYDDQSQADEDLSLAHDEEVRAKHIFERTQRRAMLSNECPRVTRGGYTAAERDAWVDEQCAPVREVYELAEAKRKAAEGHLRTLFQQGTIAATLAKSVGQAFRLPAGER